MLTRTLRLFAWFTLGVALAGYSLLAFSATSYSGVFGDTWRRQGTANFSAATAVDSCRLIWASYYPGSAFSGAVSAYTYTGSIVSAACLTVAGNNSIHSVYAAISCPYGGTLTGGQCSNAPDCPPGESRDATGQCRGDPCADTAGQVAAQGLFDMGVNPSVGIPAVACAPNGCNVRFGGVYPAKAGLVNGTTHYYALGHYEYFPDATQATDGCTPGSANSIPSSTLTVPPDTCAANQGKATMNGKTVCIMTTDGKPADTNGMPPDTTPKPGNGSTTTTTTDPNTGNKVTTNTTTAPDGSSSVTTTTCDAGGNCSSSTTNTPGAGGGTGAWTGGSGGSGGANGGGAGSGDADGDGKADNPTGTTDDATSDYCAENPSNPMCAEIKAGTGASTDGLYTKGSRTATDVFNDFGNKVKGAGFYSAATNYFSASVPSGSCSGLSQSFDFGGGQSVMIDLDSIFCGSTAAAIFSILGYGLMLAASWTAFRIAIL